MFFGVCFGIFVVVVVLVGLVCVGRRLGGFVGGIFGS